MPRARCPYRLSYQTLILLPLPFLCFNFHDDQICVLNTKLGTDVCIVSAVGVQHGVPECFFHPPICRSCLLLLRFGGGARRVLKSNVQGDVGNGIVLVRSHLFLSSFLKSTGSVEATKRGVCSPQQGAAPI